MDGEEDITIAIIRMEKLLADISSKICESIGKYNVQNSVLVQKIIDCFEFFVKYVVTRMKRTPDVERMHSINLHVCHTKITETLLEFEALQNISEEQNLNFEILLRSIITCVNDEEELMRSIKKISEINIPKEVENSLSKMLNVREQKEAYKKLLQSEIDLAERRLHNVMEFNATTEKILLDKCTKVEQEYTDLLAKYDCDIGACHALMEKLFRENKLINSEKKGMEDQLVMQRVLYNQLKEQREIALMKIFTEKLELFRRNKAAKTIQKTWRAYIERISIKKRRKARRK